MAGIVLGEQAARQVAETVRTVRNQIQGSGSIPHKFRQIIFKGEAIIGKTSSAISALSGSTPGNGTVTWYTFDGSTVASTSTDFTVYNITTTAATSGRWCQCKRIGAYLWIDVESCTT